MPPVRIPASFKPVVQSAVKTFRRHHGYARRSAIHFLTADDDTPQTARPHPTATQIRNHAHTPAFKPLPRFPVGRRLDSLAVFRRHALAGRAFACAQCAGRRVVVRRCGAVCLCAAGCVAGGGGGVSAAESGGGKPPLGGNRRGGVVERRAGSFRRPLAV